MFVLVLALTTKDENQTPNRILSTTIFPEIRATTPYPVAKGAPMGNKSDVGSFSIRLLRTNRPIPRVIQLPVASEARCLARSRYMCPNSPIDRSVPRMIS